MFAGSSIIMGGNSVNFHTLGNSEKRIIAQRVISVNCLREKENNFFIYIYLQFFDTEYIEYCEDEFTYSGIKLVLNMGEIGGMSGSGRERIFISI